MATIAENIGLTWGWALQENGWKSGMDQNLRSLDLLPQCVILSAAMSAPPASPDDGAAYIVGSSPTGAWAGRANQIARYNAAASAWEFFAPKYGWECFNQATGFRLRYSGSAWGISHPSGTGVAQRLAFWSGTNALSSSSDLTYDESDLRLRGGSYQVLTEGGSFASATLGDGALYLRPPSTTSAQTYSEISSPSMKHIALRSLASDGLVTVDLSGDLNASGSVSAESMTVSGNMAVGDVDDLETELGVVSETEINIYSYIPRTEWAGIRANTSTYDCLAAFNSAIAAARSGQRLRIPAGRYRVSGTVNVTKQLRLVGDSVGIGGDGSQIYRTGDFIALHVHGDTSAGTYINIGGIENINVGGVAGTADFMKIDYVLGGSIDNLCINGSTTGAFLRIARSQDIAVYRMFLRHSDPTAGTEGLLVFDPPDTTDGTINCNDIRFIGCHLEHSGPLVRSLYTSGAGRNNTIAFTNTKFESGGYASPLIILDCPSRWVFDQACRYNQYAEQVFSVYGGEDCFIGGIPGRNTAAPTVGFGTFTACSAFTISLVGNLVGAIVKNNCSRFVVTRVLDPTSSLVSDEYGIAASGMGTDYLQYHSNRLNGTLVEVDSSEYCGEVIKSHAIDYANIIGIRPAPFSLAKNGLTFLLRAKSSAGTPMLDIRAKSSVTGLDTSIGTLSLSTTYAWARFTIPPNIAGTIGLVIYVVTTVMSGNSAYISEWKFEDEVFATAAPTSGTWTTGARVWNSAPSAGGYTGWVCVSGGTPGTWKGFGVVAT